MNALHPTDEQVERCRRELWIAGLVVVCGGPAILMVLGLSLYGLTRLIGVAP